MGVEVPLLREFDAGMIGPASRGVLQSGHGYSINQQAVAWGNLSIDPAHRVGCAGFVARWLAGSPEGIGYWQVTGPGLLRMAANGVEGADRALATLSRLMRMAVGDADQPRVLVASEGISSTRPTHPGYYPYGARLGTPAAEDALVALGTAAARGNRERQSLAMWRELRAVGALQSNRNPLPRATLMAWNTPPAMTSCRPPWPLAVLDCRPHGRAIVVLGPPEGWSSYDNLVWLSMPDTGQMMGTPINSAKHPGGGGWYCGPVRVRVEPDRLVATYGAGTHPGKRGATPVQQWAAWPVSGSRVTLWDGEQWSAITGGEFLTWSEARGGGSAPTSTPPPPGNRPADQPHRPPTRPDRWGMLRISWGDLSVALPVEGVRGVPWVTALARGEMPQDLAGHLAGGAGERAGL